MITCPNCGDTVYATDTLNSEWFGNEYYDTVEGTCPKCGKIWRWEEIYSFSRDSNIHEISSDGHF